MLVNSFRTIGILGVNSQVLLEIAEKEDNQTQLLADIYQAINAIIVYYLSLLKNKKTNISIKLSIPSKLNNIYDKDLCIIIGNLLENAVEACNKLDNKTKSFIKLNSRLQYDTLTITLDNSFNGLYKKEDDIFISSKRNEPGIGINSIKNVVKKYNGGYKFETKKHTFMASIYLKINN